MNSKLYFGGNIFPNANAKKVEALFVCDGIVSALGDKKHLLSKCDETTQFIDLQGKTLLPSFSDTHGHLMDLAASLVQPDLYHVHSFDEIVDVLVQYKKDYNIQDGEWISAIGYDTNKLEEKSHPDKSLLDQALPNNPVVCTHYTGHMGAFNTLGLKKLEIDNTIEDIPGGYIARDEITKDLTGYMEEEAFVHFEGKVPKSTKERIYNQIEAAEKIYLKNGYTTIQEAILTPEKWEMLSEYAMENRFHADVLCYTQIDKNPQLIKSYSEQFDHHLKLKGYKLLLDGSPQVRTAWITQPYKSGPANNYAYGLFQDCQVIDFCAKALCENKQLVVHCNGDAACEQFLRCMRIASENTSIPAKTICPVMVHAQFLRADQMEAMRELGMYVSFFAAHLYFFSDVHIQNFGYERASKISPAKSALKHDLNVTFHNDTPVTRPNALQSAQCAMRRISCNGTKLDEKEKISIEDALEIITINAAKQNQDSETKGSLDVGKQADMVVLNQNPFESMEGIFVEQTIKSGEIVYRY